MSVRTARSRRPRTWFLEHGLPYFVDDVRIDVRRRLHRSRVVLVLVVSLVVGAAVGVVTGLVADGDGASAGFTTGLTVALVIVSLYALRALQTASIARWAAGRAFVEPRSAGAAGDAGAADAAAVHHVLLHQHRGLAGRRRPELGRPGRDGAVLRPRRGVLPGGPARRGARRRRRHRRTPRRSSPAAPARRSRTPPASSPPSVPTSPSTPRSSGSRRPTWSWPW